MKEQTPTRDRADELGIKYHHNANDATIQKLIDAHEAKAAEEQATKDSISERDDILPLEECMPMDQKEFKKTYFNPSVNKKRAAALVRCRIQCMDPKKKEWPGEIVSVGSAKLGTFKKYVPYNSPEPYHIPRIIFDMLKEKKCTIWYSEQDERGNTVRKGRQVNAYAIEELPPLTKDELSDLARVQAMRAGQR